MAGISVSELFILLLTALIWLAIPLAVVIWLIVALRRIRADNEAIKSRLDAVEQLQRNIHQASI
jgi:hypothetical protein